MLQTSYSRVSYTTGPGDVVEYLLGLGAYAYLDPHQYAEEYHRLHQVIRALTQSASGDRESDVLALGAQLSQVDRLLAALFVEGARERLAASELHWTHISEATYFGVALAHGMLLDYVSFAGHFAVPPNSDHNDPLARYRRFAEHFLALPEGHARQGQRLGVLRLFDRGEDGVAVGLALCEQLRVRDPALAVLSESRVLLALERGEITRYDPAYRDLGVQMVAAAGRWAVAPALPHLRRLLESTPPRDRQARVLRANLLRSIEQLTTGPG
jgi:hypothetical protein